MQDDDVLDIDPNNFTATEIREISKHGVEFYDRDTNRHLRVKGEFEVYPVFPEPTQGPET